MKRWIASLLLILPLAAAVAQKYVEIDKTTQTLRAYDGRRLILQTRVSTGKRDSWTPNGLFRIGAKYEMHYSTIYHHAPMPYSVQVNGNIFIHGFSYVPEWPDSHGCIRVPLDGKNPAKQLFAWVDSGTPVRITGHWIAEKNRNPVSSPTEVRKANLRRLSGTRQYRRS